MHAFAALCSCREEPLDILLNNLCNESEKRTTVPSSALYIWQDTHSLSKTKTIDLNFPCHLVSETQKRPLCTHVITWYHWFVGLCVLKSHIVSLRCHKRTKGFNFGTDPTWGCCFDNYVSELTALSIKTNSPTPTKKKKKINQWPVTALLNVN